jgi:hypothetical protein
LSAYPVSPVRVPASTCVVEAAITHGHQKIALAHLGEQGGSWCLASDEGAYLRGTDTAPAPLMHWAAGVHADLMARSRARGPVVIEFGYAVSGSFAQGGAHGSEAPDAEDPFLKHAGAPRPLAEPQPPLIGREPPDPQAKIFTMPTSTDGLRFGSRVEGAMRHGVVHSSVTFPGIPSSRFSFVADLEGARAPSGLAYAWAGVAFCYLTQISRYIEARKLAVSGARLVQTGPLAGPVDTHLFLNGAAPDAAMQELLAMGTRTCYLHATLGAALSPEFN